MEGSWIWDSNRERKHRTMTASGNWPNPMRSVQCGLPNSTDLMPTAALRLPKEIYGFMLNCRAHAVLPLVTSQGSTRYARC